MIANPPINSRWKKLIAEANSPGPKFGAVRMKIAFKNNEPAEASAKNKVDQLVFKKGDQNEWPLLTMDQKNLGNHCRHHKGVISLKCANDKILRNNLEETCAVII
jgi:hypothetical protein